MPNYVFLKGKCKWAKLVTPDAKFNTWNIVLYPDNDSYNTVMDLKEKKGEVDGIMNVIKKDEDGYNLTLKRPTSIKTREGRLIPFNPPLMLDAKNLDNEGKPLPLVNTLIGNGSDVTCKVEVRKYKKPIGGWGKALRLESIRVDNLIPYTGSRDYTEAEQGMNDELVDQPEPLF